MPQWKKLGNIFDIAQLPSWAKTHSQVPTPLLYEDYIRVYFVTRNEHNRSYPIYADYDLNDLTKVINISEKPVMDLGKPGTFDDSGVMPTCARLVDNKIYLYYIGWNKKVLTSYHLAIGLAISEDGGNSFTRAYEGPIMDRNKYEPYIITGPEVVKGHDCWKIWYVAGVSWTKIADKYEPQYDIRYAESDNGIDWQRSGKTCIPMNYPTEALAEPSVLKIDDRYHMWFSHRDSTDYRDGKGSYQIGYAYSDDGKEWLRDDARAGIEKSTDGWDSTMICYSKVIKIGDNYYMYHNGNGFGQTGFGLAILESID